MFFYTQYIVFVSNFQKQKNQIFWEQETNYVKEPKLPKNLIFLFEDYTNQNNSQTAYNQSPPPA